MRKIAIQIVPLVGALGMTCGLSAQVVSSQIRGSVLDSQALGVPQAVVQLRSETTGQIHTTATNETGSYLLSAVPVGRYVLSVEHPGFKRYERSGVELIANQVARIDIQLEIGSVSESINVQGALSPVNITTGTLGTLIDQRRIVDLPLNGRNILSLAALTPGVTRVSTVDGPSNGQQRVNANGGRGYSTTMMLDGAMMAHNHRGWQLIPPPPEAVQEVQVSTNGLSAEFGRGSAVVSAITRNGTNELHGAAWEFFRNDFMDARSFFARSVPKLRYNQFGGALGGPIRRDKAFFFGTYQRLESRSDRVLSSAFTPTAAERNGEFSASRGGRPRDPLNNQPFPDGRIPMNRFDPVSVKIANRIPQPNQANGSYIVQRSIPVHGDMLMARGDYDFTARDRTTFRYFRDNPRSENPFSGSNFDGYVNSLNDGKTKNMNAAHTHTFRPDLLLTARWSYNRFAFSNPNLVRDTLESLGSRFVSGGGPGSMPLLFIAGRFNAVPEREGVNLSNIYESGGDLSWFRGRHELKTGVLIQRMRYNIVTSGRSYGEFQFSGIFTGNSLADYYLGPAESLRQEAFRDNNVLHWNNGFYVQDRWRATRRLTLNLGLRYEILTPWREPDGKLSTLLPGVQSRTFPTAPRGLVLQTDPEFTYQTDFGNLSPRFGFALDLSGDGKTSLRGGYTVSYEQMVGHVAGQNSPPFATDLLTTNAGPLSDPQRFVTIPYGKPFDRQNPVFVTPLALTNSFIGDIDTARSQNINLTLERELPGGVLVQGSYVAVLGRHVSTTQQMNPAEFRAGQSTARNIEERRIFFPQFGSVQGYATDGNSDYHGLQAVVSRRFSKGYSFSLGYAFAKAIDETSTSESADSWFAQDPNDRRGSRGLSDFDTRHRVVVSGIWELPFLSKSTGLVSRVLGGWQLSGLGTMQTGFPVNVTAGRDNSLRGVGRDRPDLVGDPKLPSGRSKDEQLQRWFNTSVFRASQPGLYGTAGRNIITGPGLMGFDLSLNKKTTMGEGRTLELRWDVFNAFNRANFSNPGGNQSGTATFGRITSADSGRIMQLGLRFQF